jgi:predicted permease
MKDIARQLELQYPDSNRNQGATVLLLRDVIFGDVRPVLIMLFSGGGLLLLITCMNVASLLLVRAEGRRREIAVRGALGASRGRLRRQFVIEGAVLVTIGAGLGLAAAISSMRLVTLLVPKDMLDGMPYLQAAGLNWRVAAVSIAVAVLAAALFAVVPAFRLTSTDVRGSLAEGGRGSAGTIWRRFGAGFVALEIATAVVLLVSAGLLGKSFYHLLQQDPGLQPDHLAFVRAGMPLDADAHPQQAIARERQIVERISAIPGVKTVGVTNKLPLGDGDWTTQFHVVGRPSRGETNEVAHRFVTPSYFPTLGARLLRGRYFTDTDNASKPAICIINQALARQYFAGEDPLRLRISYNSREETPIEIVGIVDDVREGALDTPPRAALYVPYYQRPSSNVAFVVRTAQSEESVLRAMEAALRGIDPNILVTDPGTMKDRIRNAPSSYLRRSSAWLAAAFAGIALLLGVVGLYGVVAYSVAQRTREIGIRMALGAKPSSIYELILKEAGRLIVAGVSLGLVCSIGAAALLRTLLFGVRWWDAETMVGVAVVLAICALVATWVPARRAASIHVVEALRSE